MTGKAGERRNVLTGKAGERRKVLTAKVGERKKGTQEREERQGRFVEQRLASQHELEMKKLEVHGKLRLNPRSEKSNKKFDVANYIK